jgi:hypothetical protein
VDESGRVILGRIQASQLNGICELKFSKTLILKQMKDKNQKQNTSTFA